MPAQRPLIRRYQEVRDLIQDSDVLLFRRPRGFFSFISRAISVAGRSDHTHCAMALWVPGRGADAEALMCSEVKEWHGGRAVTLSSQVKKYPRRIDVYRCNHGNLWPWFKPRAAAVAMLREAGSHYGYWSVIKASFGHLPLLQLIFGYRPDTDDEAPSGYQKYCSEAVSFALRTAGGVDPVKSLADRSTEPGDIERSVFTTYLFTLLWDEDAQGIAAA